MIISDSVHQNKFDLQDKEAAAEYWVLEAVALDQRPIGQLYPEFILPKITTQEPQNLTPQKLFRILKSLSNQGLVNFYFSYEDVYQKVDMADMYELISFERMQDQISEENCLDFYCRISDVGGLFWEKISQPKWEDFIDWYSDQSQEVKVFYITSPNNLLIKKYLENPSVKAKVQQGSIEWNSETLSPSLYWKTLPIVYFATFTSADDDIFVRYPVAERFKWYKSPFPKLY